MNLERNMRNIFGHAFFAAAINHRFYIFSRIWVETMQISIISTENGKFF